MAADPMDIAQRGVIFERAQSMVAPLVEQHGVEKVSFGGGFFAVSDVITPVDQHINSIIRVADWLLGEEEY